MPELKNFQLFTLRSIFSTYRSGTEQIPETNKLNQTYRGLRIPKSHNGIMALAILTSHRRTGWLFTNVVEDSNSGLLKTNPASGENGT